MTGFLRPKVSYRLSIAILYDIFCVFNEKDVAVSVDDFLKSFENKQDTAMARRYVDFILKNVPKEKALLFPISPDKLDILLVRDYPKTQEYDKIKPILHCQLETLEHQRKIYFQQDNLYITADYFNT